MSNNKTKYRISEKKQMKEVQKTFKDDKNNEEEDEYGDNVEKMEEAEKNLIIGFVGFYMMSVN